MLSLCIKPLPFLICPIVGDVLGRFVAFDNQTEGVSYEASAAEEAPLGTGCEALNSHIRI